jgi:hypothetical protein
MAEQSGGYLRGGISAPSACQATNQHEAFQWRSN